MRSLVQICIFAFQILAWMSLLPLLAPGQTSFPIVIGDNKKDWQRIVSAADSNIDVGTSSLVLEPSGLFRAKFRTTLSKSEEAFEKPGVKYKTRLETIQFDSRKGVYRIIETTLLDSSEKPVLSFAPKTDVWKTVGRTAAKMYGAASALHPLGSWMVMSVRYVDGGAISRDEDSNVTKLLGSFVVSRFDQFQLGADACGSPDYESGSMTRSELERRIGSRLKGAGLDGDNVDALKITCASRGSSEVHLLFLLPRDRALLLSGGILLDLERPK